MGTKEIERPMSQYDKVLKRVSEAIGISERSVKRILQDKENKVGIEINSVENRK